MRSKTSNVILRYMEPADMQALFLMENDPDNIKYTINSQAPYTLEQIECFIRTSARDLQTQSQLRFMIELDGQLAGAIDLYDYSAAVGQAWVAILIYPRDFRRQGVASRALEKLIGIAVSYDLQELKAQVSLDNCASRALFLSAGFLPVSGEVDVLSFCVLPKHLWIGRRGERLAEDYLRREGFQIVERNWRSATYGERSAARYGEIDLIAKRDGSLYFVEVKTRVGDAFDGDYSPQMAFNKTKISRTATISEHYLRESDFSGEVFNVLLVVNITDEGRGVVRYFPVTL